MIRKLTTPISILITILGVVALSLLNTFGSYSFVGAGLLGLVYIIIICASIILLSISILTKNKKVLINSLLLIGGILISLLASNLVNDYQIKGSKEKASIIINALENYRKDNESYPLTLEGLSPKYLEAIPNSSMGFFNNPFFYEGAKDNYSLSFLCPAWIICDYNQKTQRWEFHD